MFKDQSTYGFNQLSKQTANPFPNTPFWDRPKLKKKKKKLQTTTEMWLFKDFKIQIT